MDEQIAEPETNEIVTDENGYTYKKAKQWDLFNSFNFESDELRGVICDADPGNAGITQEMLSY